MNCNQNHSTKQSFQTGSNLHHSSSSQRISNARADPQNSHNGNNRSKQNQNNQNGQIHGNQQKSSNYNEAAGHTPRRQIASAQGVLTENKQVRQQSNQNIQQIISKDTMVHGGSISTFTKLEPKRIIGSGSFGYVFEAFDKESNQVVAVKRTQKAGEYVSREYEVLNRLRECKNVVKMLDIYYSRSEDGKTAQNLVFEFCNKNLEEIIQETKKNAIFMKENPGQVQQLNQNNQFTRIPIQDIKSYMKQIFEGMAYVHSQGISHRDLKPENILLNNKGVVKVCDFGSAKFLDDKLNTPYIVSRYYRAPELILACSDYSEKIDVWAIGCIFAEFMTLRPMFPGKTEGSQLIEQIAILGLPSKETMKKMSSQISSHTIELVHKLDDMPPRKMTTILPHKDYNKKDIEDAADLLSKLLTWVPNERISCQEALKHPFFKGVKALKQ